ncbi:MAG TPA: DUF4783 domain-containing protein [Chitinophagales bacterium]|nr:DUF4783 domain-containing protein [Chitinophagales bacterium]
MKALFASFFAILLLNVPLKAQSLDNIATAIRTGNSSSLAASFQGNVEITIKDAGNSYSKSQAEMVLKNFFGSHQPKTFAVAHQGTSPEGSKYFIGNLTTSAGNYRVFVLFSKAAGAIQEIRFEEQ